MRPIPTLARRACMEHALTQSALAHVLGVSRRTVSALVAGSRQAEGAYDLILHQLAHAPPEKWPERLQLAVAQARVAYPDRRRHRG